MKFNNTLKSLKVFLKDKKKKKFYIMLWEVSVLTVLKRGFPFYYFGRFVYRKDTGDFKDYFSTREYFKIIRSQKLNSSELDPVLENKLFFALFSEGNNLPVAKTWSYNLKNVFYFEDASFLVKSKIELISCFKRVFEESDKDRLFLKPFNTNGGKGILLLKHTKMESQLNDFGDQLLNNFYIHQEAIVQHPEIDKIYSGSINTLRIMTYLDSHGKIDFLETFMRFGSGGAVIDNLSRGGFFVPLNMDSGILGERGFQDLKFGGGIYERIHPDTDYPFKNFKVPYFKESHDLCGKLAKLMPSRLIGWDVAITPIGPIIIEGNTGPGILTGETNYGGYLKHPIYQKMLSES